MKKKYIIIFLLVPGFVAVIRMFSFRDNNISTKKSSINENSKITLHSGQVAKSDSVKNTTERHNILKETNLQTANKQESNPDLRGKFKPKDSVINGASVVSNAKNNGMVSIDKNSQNVDGFMLPVVNNSNIAVENSESTTILYIAETDSNRVIRCNVSNIFTNHVLDNAADVSNNKISPDRLNSCRVVVRNLAEPENMLVNNNKLYITNYKNSNITICSLANDGQVLDCENTKIPFVNPVYITEGSAHQLYVSGFEESGLIKSVGCGLDQRGYITACSSIFGVSKNLLKAANFNGYSYTTNWSQDAINKCNASSCVLLQNIAISKPLGISVAKNAAYISNADKIVGCGVDLITGNFFACKVMMSGLNLPIGLVQYSAN